MATALPDIESGLADFSRSQVLKALEEVFENEEKDHALNVLSALVLEDGLSKIVVHGDPANFRLELQGPICGPMPTLQALFPLQAALRHLTPYLWWKLEQVGERRRHEQGSASADVQTASQGMPSDAVWTSSFDRQRSVRHVRSEPWPLPEGDPAWVWSEK